MVCQCCPIPVLIFVIENQEIAMVKFTSKPFYLVLALILLILSMLACGSAASTPAPVADTAVVSEPTATQEASSEAPGTSPQNPASRDEVIVTASWEFSVLEVHRGEDAMSMLKEASAFNDAHPDPTMEYVLVKVHAKYAGTDSGTHHIDANFFLGMDGTGVLYDKVSIIDVDAPDPSISSFDDLSAG